MLIDILLMGAVVSAQSAPPAAQSAAPGLEVVVAAPVYQPDGGVTVETAAMSGEGPRVAYLFARRSVCDTSAAGADLPADAGFGWRITTHTIRATPQDVVVSVDWRRMWDRGGRLDDGPGGTVQLRLRPGDRIPLDHIQNRDAGGCRAVGMGLEVRAARSGAALPRTEASPIGTVVGGDPLHADLWLVHSSGGTQRAQHQRIRVVNGRGTFSFTPVPVSTPAGEVSVDFLGSVVRHRTPSGQDFLLVTMSRLVSGNGLPAGGVSSRTSSLTALPERDDVLSFEMPTAAPAGARGRGGRGGTGGGGGGLGSGFATAPTGGAVRGTAGTAPPAAGLQTVTTSDIATLLQGQTFALRLQVTSEK
jgi:hypothetical protein